MDFDDLSEFTKALPPTGSLMGLDLGTKTIGLAISDTHRMIATADVTLKKNKLSQDVIALSTVIAERNIVGLVLGLPKNMNGSEGPRAQSTRSFARNIIAQLELPLHLWDERLSTAAVTRTLLEADASRKRRSEVVDKMAAAYILQGALDRISSMKRKTHTS
jgi:putative Holliday junction resolvase